MRQEQGGALEPDAVGRHEDAQELHGGDDDAEVGEERGGLEEELGQAQTRRRSKPHHTMREAGRGRGVRRSSTLDEVPEAPEVGGVGVLGGGGEGEGGVAVGGAEGRVVDEGRGCRDHKHARGRLNKELGSAGEEEAVAGAG